MPVSDPVRLLTKLCTSLMLHMSCRDDRIAWMTALTHARLPGSNLAAFPVDSSQIANGVTAVLPTNGTTSEPAVAALANTVTDLQTCADVALQPATLRLMATLQQQLRQVAAVLEEREDQIRQLMDERRQLQTELVAESQGLDGLAVWPTSQLWCLSAATDLFLCRQQHCTPSQRLHGMMACAANGRRRYVHLKRALSKAHKGWTHPNITTACVAFTIAPTCQ